MYDKVRKISVNFPKYFAKDQTSFQDIIHDLSSMNTTLGPSEVPPF
jgi:hypothetical protein